MAGCIAYAGRGFSEGRPAHAARRSPPRRTACRPRGSCSRRTRRASWSTCWPRTSGGGTWSSAAGSRSSRAGGCGRTDAPERPDLLHHLARPSRPAVLDVADDEHAAPPRRVARGVACREGRAAGPRTAIRGPALLSLRAAARVAAVGALVAGAAADHDRAAGRARRRVFLVLDRRERAPPSPTARLRAGRHRPSACRDVAAAAARASSTVLAAVDAGVELRLRRQELRRHPPEDVVDDRLREADLRVLRHARRLEADVAELVHQRLQRHAVLQRVGDRLRERVGEAARSSSLPSPSRGRSRPAGRPRTGRR